MISETTLLLGLGMLGSATPAAARECVRSPGAVLELCVSVADGQALYAVMRGGTEVIAPSRLGLAFAGEADPRYTAITSTARSASDTTWEQPWGEQRLIRDKQDRKSTRLNSSH